MTWLVIIVLNNCVIHMTKEFDDGILMYKRYEPPQRGICSCVWLSFADDGDKTCMLARRKNPRVEPRVMPGTRVCLLAIGLGDTKDFPCYTKFSDL